MRTKAYSLMAAVLAMAGTARAATWTGPDMTWTQPDSDSWSPSYANNDMALFTGSAVGTITVDGGGVTPAGINITSGSYTFTGGSINGTGTVTKSGSGTLRLSGNNTYTGGTVMNAGTLCFTNSANLGAAGSGITFNNSAALSFGPNNDWAFASGGTPDLGAHPITLSNGAVAGLYYNTPNTTMTVSDAITGNGGIIWGRDPVVTFGGGSGGEYANLLSTGNTFTGPLTIGVGSENIGTGCDFTFNSLADSSSALTFNVGGGNTFSYGAGAVTNLWLPNRRIDLWNSSTTIRNQNATYTMTFGAVSTTTGGGKTLNLGNGGAGGTIAGAITDGNGQIAVTKSGGGTWILSGTNTYSGATTISGGKLILSNAWSVASGNLVVTSGKARLDYVGTRAVAGLVFSGTNQSPGVYNSANSATYLEGTGNLITGIQTFSVTYNCTNATGGTVPVDWNAYTNGQEVTVMGTGTLVRTSYRFGAWSTQADAGGVNYLPGSTFTITTHTTLYAKWPPKGTVITIR